MPIPIVNERYRLHGAEFEVVSTDQKHAQFSAVIGQRQISFTHFKVNDMIEKGELVKSQSAPIDQSKAPILLNMSPAERAKHERKVKYTVGALEALGNTLPREATKAYISELAKKIDDPSPPSYSTLYGWIKKYRQSGNSTLALIKNKHLQLPRGKKLDDKIIEITEDIIEQHYLIRERPSGQFVYNILTTAIAKNNEHRPYTEQIKAPSRATFFRILSKIDPYKLDLLREGRAYAEKKNKYGRNIRKSLHMYQRIEADTQQLDLIVVDIYGKVIGRPYLTAFIECKSRMIIGWELSMTPPCAAKTMKALKMSLRSDNPIAGKGEIYYIDNGSEFLNESFVNFFRIYGSKVLPLPPGKPDQKSFIERFFLTLNLTLIHNIKGTTKSSPAKRRDYDSAKNARLTVDGIRLTFKRWLDEYYHQHPQKGLSATPQNVFDKSMEHELPPDTYALNELDITCRKTNARTISNGRVTMFNLQWYGPGLARLDDKARKYKCKPLVHYDESDLSTVWLSIPQEPGVMVQANAVDPDYQNGLTLYEHKLACDAIDKQGLAFSKQKAARALAEIYLSLSELEYEKPKRQIKQVLATTTKTEDMSHHALDESEHDDNLSVPDTYITAMPDTAEPDDDLEFFTLE